MNGPACEGHRRASEFELFDLIGRRVRSRRSLPLLPVGSTGEVVDVCGERGAPPNIIVQWDEHNFRDAFYRDSKRDETRWLELIDLPARTRALAAESANVLTAAGDWTLVAPRTGR